MTLQYTKFKRSSKLNLVAELYVRLKLRNIETYVHYPFKSIRRRSDLIIVKNKKVLAIVVCQNTPKKLHFNYTDCRYLEFKTLGVPVLGLHRFEELEDILAQLESIWSQSLILSSDLFYVES